MQSHKNLSPRGEVNVKLEVALINPIRKDWNADLVKQLFLPFEVDRVLRISLNCRLPADSYCDGILRRMESIQFVQHTRRCWRMYGVRVHGQYL